MAGLGNRDSGQSLTSERGGERSTRGGRGRGARALGWLWAGAVAAALASPAQAADPFVSYQIRPSATGPRFAKKLGIKVEDGRASKRYDLTKFGGLLVPAGTAVAPLRPELHLAYYQITAGRVCSTNGAACLSSADCSGGTCAKETADRRHTRVVAQGSFGQLRLDLVKPEALLLPAAFDLGAQPQPLDAAVVGADAYKCYQARLSAGEPLPAASEAVLSDALSAGTRRFPLGKLSQLCLPATVQGSALHQRDEGLLCYSSRPVPGGAVHVPRNGAFATDALGSLGLGTVREQAVCLPASVEVALPSCDVVFLPPTVAPGEAATVGWSSAEASSCSLACTGELLPETVPCRESLRLRAGSERGSAPKTCTLTAQTSAGGSAQCRATLGAAGSCAAPTCSLTAEAGAGAAPLLRAASNGASCSYSCDSGPAGVMPCNGALQVGADTSRCRLWATSACGSTTRCSTTTWSHSISVDGDPTEWPDETRVPTARGVGLVSWDEEFIYLGYEGRDLAQPNSSLSFVAYLGNGQAGVVGRGPQFGLQIGTQVAALPVHMSHAIAWRLDGSGSAPVVYTADSRGTWARSASARSGSLAWAHSTDPGAVELAIPRSLIGDAQKVDVVMQLVDATAGAERSYPILPPDAHSHDYQPPGSSIEKWQHLDLSDWQWPSSSEGEANFDLPPLPGIPIPTPVPGDALRIVTHNVGVMEIRTPAVDQHIAGFCIALAAAGASVGALFGGPAAGVAAGLACAFALPLILDAEEEKLKDLIDTELTDVQRAGKIASKILDSLPDVVALNEANDEDARQELLGKLEKHYPYVVAMLQGTPEFVGDEILEDWHGFRYFQDSGLMLFSRHPFVALNDNSLDHLAPDDDVVIRVNGVEVANSSSKFVAWADYADVADPNTLDCWMEDCGAGKGAGLVRILKPAAAAPATVVFSHLQSSSGVNNSDNLDDNEKNMKVRKYQLGRIQTLIEETLEPKERAEEPVYVLGDLNVIGRHADGSDDQHAAETESGCLNGLQNETWDFGRREWLWHFCGLRPLQGTLTTDHPCFNASPPGDNLGNPPAAGFFGCGNGDPDSCRNAASGTPLLVDGWAYDSSPEDAGMTWAEGAVDVAPAACTHHEQAVIDERVISSLCSSERLDYVLHNRPDIAARDSNDGTSSSDGLSDRRSLCAQHLTIAWNLTGVGSENNLSDHLPVHADMNRWAPHCRPREAQVASCDDFDLAPDFFFNGKINFPGSMQWLRIDAGGSFSIDVDSGFAFEVYKPSDLSRPVPSYHEEQSEDGTRYNLPSPPYYVRVFAEKSQPYPPKTPDYAATGLYELRIHRHTCKTLGDRCTVDLGSSWTGRWPVDQPPNPEDDVFWFEFSSYDDSEGETPTFHLEHESVTGCDQGFALEVIDPGPLDGLGYPQGDPQLIISNVDGDPANDFDSYVAGQNKVHAETIQRLAGGGPVTRKSYLLRVKRQEDQFWGQCYPCVDSNQTCSAPGFGDVTVRVGTDLTFFYPSMLKVDVAEDFEIFSKIDVDELYYNLRINKPLIHKSTTATPEYLELGEFGEGSKPKSIAKVKYNKNNPPAFVKNLHLYLLEENTDDPNDTWLEPRHVMWGCSGDSLSSGPKGAVCPLSWAEPNSQASTIRYRDTGGDDPKYDMTVTACLSHEKYETDGNKTPHQQCVAAHSPNEVSKACADAPGSVCP